MKEYLKELKEELKQRDTIYLLVSIVLFSLSMAFALTLASVLLSFALYLIWDVAAIVFIIVMIATILMILC